MDTVSYGALFLLATFVTAYLGDTSILDKGSEAPWLVVLGIGGAAGVGALLSLTGNAIWNFVWPYSPSRGWRAFVPREQADFRSREAKDLGPWWTATEGLGSEGDRVLVATAFQLYKAAPAEVLGWIQRRHERQAAALSSVAAIVIGLLSGLVIVPVLTPTRLVVSLLLLAVAFATTDYALQVRREATHMEAYWFKVRPKTSVDSSGTPVG